MVSIFGQRGEIGQLCGAHVVRWENGYVMAGGESGRSGTGFGVKWASVCQSAYNDESAAYLASVGVCSGEGSVDLCVVCAGGEYPTGPARACGVYPPGEYRHATSYACDPCAADSAKCQAVFGSRAWALDGSLTCGGLVSGCVSS